MSDDELKKYIPKFLPSGEQDDLFYGLKQITDNKEAYMYKLKNFYSTYGTEKDPYLDQGDGLADMKIYNLPNPASRDGLGFVLSNTCDINPDNERDIPMRILYAPVLNLDKYVRLLKEKGIYREGWIENVRQQKITHLIYLPKGPGLDYEAIVPLDHIISVDQDSVPVASIREKRVFQLSRIAWYILLIKITHHFARTNKGLFLNRSPNFNP